VLGRADRERTAYHEAGHAVVGMLSPGADPVRKVSIIPRGRALGVTLSTPEDDRFSYEEPYLRTLIKVALGGRAAEELVFGIFTTGAENDLQQLTNIARQMVGRWGMSRAVGHVTVLSLDGQGPASQRTQELVDDEVRRIVEELYEEAVALLREHRASLDRLAEALLEHETLDQADAYEAAGIAQPRSTREPPTMASRPSSKRTQALPPPS
jgi:cell division protease FtsH